MSTSGQTQAPEGDQRPKLFAVFIIFDVLAVVAIALRFVCRRMSRASLWWDDWLIIPAFLLFIASIVVDFEDIAHGAGRHTQAISAAKLPGFLKVKSKQSQTNVKEAYPSLLDQANYAGEIVYPLSLTFIKCSLLSLIVRIFGINQQLRKWAYVLLALSASWGIVVTLVAALQCSPKEAAWDPTITSKTCINIRDYFVGTSIINVLIDVGILVLPMPSLWALQLPTSRKVIISGIFLLGIFTSAISITRTVAVYTVSEKDITWNFIPVMLYSTLEIDTGLICACLPVMGPLLQLLYSKRPKGSSDSYNRQGDYPLRRSKTPRHPTDSFSRLRDHDQRSEYTKQNREVSVEGGGSGHNGGGGDNGIFVVSSVDIIDTSVMGSK